MQRQASLGGEPQGRGREWQAPDCAGDDGTHRAASNQRRPAALSGAEREGGQGHGGCEGSDGGEGIGGGRSMTGQHRRFTFVRCVCPDIPKRTGDHYVRACPKNRKVKYPARRSAEVKPEKPRKSEDIGQERSNLIFCECFHYGGGHR